MRLAFRILVDTLRGAQEGVPGLLKILDEHNIRASFALSLGRPRIHGYRRLFAGVSRLLPTARHDTLASKAREELRSIRQNGHEIGMAPFDPQVWIADANLEDETWTRAQIDHSLDAFFDLFSEKPQFHCASDWQINHHLLALEDEYQFRFASDVRGRSIFYPRLLGIDSRCVQIPTTLPTLEEMGRRPGIGAEQVHEEIFAESMRILPHGEVFSINADHADFTTFEKLIVMWKGMQWEMMPMGDLLASNNPDGFGHHLVGWGRVTDNPDDLAMQSLPVEQAG